ncbi:hypothetical protein EHM92_01230 [bacterium]|nr:MAG: hypothetical protein EHM92_01230 [bacterium]
MNLDEIGRMLDPEFDPNAVIREHANSITQRYLLKDFSPGKIFSSVLEVNEFVRKLPGRLNKVLDRLAMLMFIVADGPGFTMPGREKEEDRCWR